MTTNPDEPAEDTWRDLVTIQYSTDPQWQGTIYRLRHHELGDTTLVSETGDHYGTLGVILDEVFDEPKPAHRGEPMTDDDTSEDRERAVVERLIDHLRDDHDLSVGLWWDRGPFCAQVFLTDNTHPDEAPCVLVHTEFLPVYDGKGVRWSGTLRTPKDYDALLEVQFEFLQRTWLGDTEAKIAADVALLVKYLHIPEA